MQVLMANSSFNSICRILKFMNLPGCRENASSSSSSSPLEASVTLVIILFERKQSVKFIGQMNVTEDKDITKNNFWVTIYFWWEPSHALQCF